jgi:ubiquinone/menaquinone biosynthesis C-methylase UbiE
MVNKETYDIIAKSWDKNRPNPFPGVQEFLESQNSNEPLLDLACGTGRHMILAEKIGYKNIVGIDFSEGQIAVAKEKGLNVRVGDMLSTGFDDNSFQTIICIASLHHLLDKEEQLEALKESHRILRPGGKILYTVWDKESKQIKEDIKKGKTTMIDESCAVVSFTHEGKKYPREYYFFSTKELSELLVNAGFEVEKAYKSNVNLYFECSKL